MCDSGSLLPSGNTFCGGIDMFAFWESMFCMICFVVVVLIPFATYYYDGDSEDLTSKEMVKISKFWPAFWKECIVISVFLLILLALYFTKSLTYIPVKEYVVPLASVQNFTYTRSPGESPYAFLPQTISLSEFTDQEVLAVNQSYIQYPVTFAVYLIGLFGWLGWWFYSFFVGVGLSSFPFDFICAYIWRPRTLAPDEYAAVEIELQDRCNEILDITMMLKRDRMDGGFTKNELRKRYVTDRIEVNKLSQMVFLLERDVEEFRACKTAEVDYNPLIPYAKLAVGIFFGIVSFLWILQIILSILTKPAASPFLSLYLISFDSWFPMFGNLTYALFSLYLLVCTVKGCFKLSVRFFCIKIQPMQIGGTMVDAFLFNLGIVLLCTIPLIHFCVLAFAGYTVNTDVFYLFAVQVEYLHFFGQFYTHNVFVWLILLSAMCVLPYFFFRPRDKASSTEDFKKSLMNKSSGGPAYSPLNTLKDLKAKGKDKGKDKGKSGKGGDIEMGGGAGTRKAWKGAFAD